MRSSNFLGVYGHTAIDVIYNSTEFPSPNTCVEMRGRTEYFGGTGANIAIMASELDVKTALASHVGSDFPVKFMEALRKNGVDTTDVLKVRNGVPLMFTLSQLSYWTDKHLGDMGLEAMKERGRVQVGKIADLTLFNPKTVKANATYKAGENGLANDGADPGSMTLATGTRAEHLFIRATVCETNTTTYTADTDYTGMSNATAVIPAATSMAVRGEFRIATKSTSAASDPTLASADCASAMVGFDEYQTPARNRLLVVD